MATTPTRTRSRLVEVALIVFGVYSVSVGLFMLFAPGTFFDTLGTFGVRNDHYIFDNATFELPLGLMLLAAVKWPTWRVPALAFATLHWGLHALSHTIDPHHGAGDLIGWLEAGGLVVTTADPGNCVARQHRCGKRRWLMRVLVAGATSVPGIPLLRELNTRGHDVIGLTSQPAKTSQIEQQGAKPVVANVFDAAQINSVVADIEPEVVVSLLTTLPKWGPKRPKDFEPARKLWSTGATNLVVAAQRAGVRRVVAESVVFAYGYPTSGPQWVDESDPYPGPPPKGGDEMLAALRGMEQTVLTSGEHSDTEGIVLRYGLFYGPRRAARRAVRQAREVVGAAGHDGHGIASWVHIDDVAKATADALDKGRGGQIYNIVDDRPQSFGDYARELSKKLHRPPPIPIPHRLVGLVASYPATAFGTTWLPLSNAKAKAELGWTPIPR